MPEFAPLADLADFASLDLHEFGCGAVAFALGEPEPTNCTRSRWVGWTAEAMEAGAVPKDGVLLMLAVEAALDCDFSMKGFA